MGCGRSSRGHRFYTDWSLPYVYDSRPVIQLATIRMPSLVSVRISLFHTSSNGFVFHVRTVNYILEINYIPNHVVNYPKPCCCRGAAYRRPSREDNSRFRHCAPQKGGRRRCTRPGATDLQATGTDINTRYGVHPSAVRVAEDVALFCKRRSSEWAPIYVQDGVRHGNRPAA